MSGPLIFFRSSRRLSFEARTQSGFNQLVREVRAGERELARAERLLRRQPWKRDRISKHLERVAVTEYQFGELGYRTGEATFEHGASAASELNEALDYALAAVDQCSLSAALTDVGRARQALAEVRKVIASVMSLRYQPWGEHRAFTEPSDPWAMNDFLVQYLAIKAKE